MHCIISLTCHVQMLQIGALGERLDQRLIGYADTGLQLKMRQLWTATCEQLQAFVRDSTAIGQHDAFDFWTGTIAALAAQLPEYHLQRLVTVQVLAAQCDALPEHRSPGELLESPTHSRHIAQLAAVEPAKDAHNSLIGQALKVGSAAIGSLAVPGWRTNGCARHGAIGCQATSWCRCGRAAGNDTSTSWATDNAGVVVLIVVATAGDHQTAACAARMVTGGRWRHQCGIALIQTR